MLSKRGSKSWSAAAYCELPGRTSVPCKLCASCVQSALVGVACAVGLGFGVGLAAFVAVVVGVGLFVGVAPLAQASGAPGMAMPSALKARNSRRLIFSVKKLSSLAILLITMRPNLLLSRQIIACCGENSNALLPLAICSHDSIP